MLLLSKLGRFSGDLGEVSELCGPRERREGIVPLSNKSCNLLDEFPLKYTYEKVAIVESLLRTLFIPPHCICFIRSF